jgi:two-component system, cell cycle response regulator
MPAAFDSIPIPGLPPEDGVTAQKILIADDSPLVLRMLERIFQEVGIGVVTAKDGLEAIEKAFSEDVRLVVMDVMMPRMNGYQACRLLKTEPSTKDLPIVILTSKDQAGDRFWGLETGADYYMTKDADPQKLVELVKSMLDSQDGSRSHADREGRTGVDILSRVNDLLDRKLFEATILSEIGRVARSIVRFDESFTSVMGVVGRVVDFTIGAMAFVEDEDLDVFLLLQRPTAPAVIEDAKGRLLEAIAGQRVGIPFAKVQARLFAPEGTKPGAEETALGGFSTFPISTGGRLAGLLAVGGKGTARLSGDVELLLAQAANQAYIVLENSRLFERIRNLSIRDSLTNLYNHKHTMDLVAGEVGRVGRYEGGVSLAMVDIDKFKQINDAHGHQAGDVVLRDVARILRDTLRNVDSLGRYGGEEFAAILPHTDLKEALQTGERIRQAVASHPFRIGPRELRVTVSVGIATYPSEAVDSPGALVREADKALYRAKQAGRDRVC